MNIRLIQRMRRWRACILSQAARTRSSTCTLNMLAAAVRARARATAPQGAVGKRTAKLCGSSEGEADVQERLGVGLHAFMLVLRTVKELGM